MVGLVGRRLNDRRQAVSEWVSTPAVLYHRTSHVFGLVEQADLLTAGRGRVLLVEDPLEVLAVHFAGDIGLGPTGTLLTGDHVRQVIAVTGPTGTGTSPTTCTAPGTP